MRITRLQLSDVKRHEDLVLDLAPGLTIIRGPNEAGKSTIQRAIEIALFRKATSEASELGGIKRWGADSEPTVVVDFEDETGAGRLAKTFAGSKGTVELTTDAGVERDPAAVERAIAGLTGLPTEKFFQATASVNHHELADLSKDENTLRDRLQQSMTGATRGTREARKKLEDAIRRYRAEGAKNPGHLKVARAEVERLEIEVASGEQALSVLEHERRALAEARDRRQAIEAELERYQEGLKAAERAVALQARGAAAQQRYETYRRAADIETEVSRLDANHPSPVPLPTLRGIVDRIRSHEYRLSEIRAELAAEPEVSFVALPEPPWRLRAAVGALLALLAVISLVGGVVLDQLLIGGLQAMVLGVAALLVGFSALRMRRRLADVQAENELRESEINRRLRGRSELFDDLRETERQRDEALAELALDDLAAADQLLADETELVGQIDTLRAEYRGLLGERQPEQSVSELRDRAAAEADQCRHALAGMGEIGAQPEKSLASYRATVERLTTEREQAVATELQADARLQANKVDAEQVAAKVEALEQARDRLGHAERRLRIYELTLAALQGAETATMKKAARYLEQSMGRDIGRITGGRYRRLRVDENSLSFSVHSAERGEWVDAKDLSRGTRDQLYLCARLGIVRQITHPATPPLVFDDPFVTFDDERARRAVEMLRDAAADLQVIYLTCSDRYDELADKVITLDGPSARDDGEDEPAAVESRPAAGVGLATPA
ncbi:MAG TPA: AAA family ATPase [Candidatus Limnocylindrales bacterium]|nr:AAA family ATPase [Candidatus Limnocylindrales bacterium]